MKWASVTVGCRNRQIRRYGFVGNKLHAWNVPQRYSTDEMAQSSAYLNSRRKWPKRAGIRRAAVYFDEASRVLFTRVPNKCLVCARQRNCSTSTRSEPLSRTLGRVRCQSPRLERKTLMNRHFRFEIGVHERKPTN